MGNRFQKEISKANNNSGQQYPQTDILSRLPSFIMIDVLSFLTFKQRMKISTVSKSLRGYKPQFIIDLVETVVENQQNANILYHEIDIQRRKQFDGDYLNLIGIQFRFLTKDQGFASVETSSSWIEAQFIDQKQLQYSEIENKKVTLVQNFKERNYKIKTKTMDLTSMKNLAKIKIYLRSMYRAWTISCKRSEARLIYS